jgi:hypothetical protein
VVLFGRHHAKRTISLHLIRFNSALRGNPHLSAMPPKKKQGTAVVDACKWRLNQQELRMVSAASCFK